MLQFRFHCFFHVFPFLLRTAETYYFTIIFVFCIFPSNLIFLHALPWKLHGICRVAAGRRIFQVIFWGIYTPQWSAWVNSEIMLYHQSSNFSDGLYNFLVASRMSVLSVFWQGVFFSLTFTFCLAQLATALFFQRRCTPFIYLLWNI